MTVTYSGLSACLGTALMEVLGGEVVLEVDGFVVTLEPEFTWVLVKVKGLGGAGRWERAERADGFKQLFPSNTDT